MILLRIFRYAKYRIEMFFKIDWFQIKYARKLPALILAGPFKGMKYINSSVGSVLLPKLIGSYEQEVHFVFEDLKHNNKYKCFIDIGSAEGYYVVGAAKFLNFEKVVAFEAQKSGRDKIKMLADLNGVSDKISIQGSCNPDNLNEVINGATFILIDVEGYENVLLDPGKIKKLLECDILLEVHNSRVPGLENIIIERFRKTHNIKKIVQHRHEVDAEVLAKYPVVKSNYDLFINEYRSDDDPWLLMTRI